MNKYKVGDIFKITWWDSVEYYILADLGDDKYNLISITNTYHPEDVGNRLIDTFDGIENVEKVLNSEVDDVLISWGRLPGKQIKVV